MKTLRTTLVAVILASLGAVGYAQLPSPPVGAPQSVQNANYGYNFQYTFVPTGTTSAGFRVAPTLALTTATGHNAYLQDFGGTISLPNSSSTATTLAGGHFNTITCTLNSGTATNCANVVIEAEPATGTNKYALWNKGVTRLDGAVNVNGTNGATHAACSSSVTAITVTNGFITAITCT